MAAAGGSELQPNIEDVFHTDVYAGNHNSSSAGSDRTMPLNNVNIADNGGLIWVRGSYSSTENAVTVIMVTALNVGLIQNVVQTKLFTLVKVITQNRL